MKLPRLTPLLLATVLSTAATFANDPNPAAVAMNQFGVDLHQRLAAKAPNANLCTSPYSIQNALAMTLAGADGATRDEMAKVLRFADGAQTHRNVAGMTAALQAIAEKSVETAAARKKYGGQIDPIVFTTANRLFGKQGYTFEKNFLEVLSETYGAPLEPVDFAKDPAAATTYINGWVEKQTRERIRDLVPPRAITEATEMVLVNAIYMKAPWSDDFSERSTRPAPFQLLDGTKKDVPTMLQQRHHGYAQREGYRAISLAYGDGSGLQFLILLPDDPKGLPDLEKKLTADALGANPSLPSAELILHLPKFKLEPPSVALGSELQAMGMKLAFDGRPGVADFGKMAARPTGQGLYIGEVFHKTFIAVDEKGTEAAAATAVLMAPGAPPPREKPKPIEVKVDHPFLFAIQHTKSGACLFLGRVTNP